MKKSTTIIIIATFLFVAGCITNFHYQTAKTDAYNKVMKDAEDTYERYTNDAADLLDGKAVDFETFNNEYFYMQNELSKWGHKSGETFTRKKLGEYTDEEIELWNLPSKMYDFHYEMIDVYYLNDEDASEKLNQVKELKQQLESLETDFDRLCEISRLD